MNKIKLLLVILLFLPYFIFCQDAVDFTFFKTNSGEIKIPGKWDQLYSVDDSNQIYLQNKEEVIIAIAQNIDKENSIFKNNKSAIENVIEFYKWDSFYKKYNQFKTKKIKENFEKKYIIWKYVDGKSDHLFVFGSKGEKFLLLLVYTNIWNEEKKTLFLENLFKINNL